jgi:hypothetical protein
VVGFKPALGTLAGTGQWWGARLNNLEAAAEGPGPPSIRRALPPRKPRPAPALLKHVVRAKPLGTQRSHREAWAIVAASPTAHTSSGSSSHGAAVVTVRAVGVAARGVAIVARLKVRVLGARLRMERKPTHGALVVGAEPFLYAELVERVLSWAWHVQHLVTFRELVDANAAFCEKRQQGNACRF